MCPRIVLMERMCKTCTPTPEDMATKQSGNLPVKTFASPTEVTNVYADGITFCLKVTLICVIGA